ncbi:hypothetical protein MSAN_00837000 [Mycena sanguinolenta]|uniref:F-box domain-containing protein n=1 Tax=Mycena sanguinolenta TaxID=230812 RepID=A0A8H6Z0P8_9AGAR|nr:hypothetical protein MSAN_00837000 [Mycena sanguinolenta]
MFEFLPNAVSPFADKLGTNYVPSDEEIAHLRDFLVGPTEQLAKIQAQIDEMELVVGQLKAKRESLQTDIDAHKALISPMRHVPEDVLREIFVACLPTAHNAVIDINSPPLLLGRICRRWRAVLYSTPMLWSSIHIPSLRSDWTQHHDRADFFPRLRPVIEQWLERSASYPLDVSLVAGDFDESTPDTHPISLLQNFSQRLRRLRFHGDLRVLLPILRLGTESLPLLRSIHLSTLANQPFSDYPDAVNLLRIPSLTAISLTVMANPLALPFKWSQLTHLSLQCSIASPDGALDGVAALDLLRRCPNLLQCHLVLDRSWDDLGLTYNASLITLPNLHTLSLRGLFHLPKWVPHLAIPKIRCLQIGDAVDPSWFLYFPDRYDSSIGAAIDTTYFTQPGLLELLQSFPLISELQFCSLNDIKAVLPDDAFLLHLASEHNICPMLTHLGVNSHCSAFSDATALAFIKGRMASPTPLQLVDFQFHRTRQVDVMPELQSLILAGLEVFLDYLGPHFDPRAGL